MRLISILHEITEFDERFVFLSEGVSLKHNIIWIIFQCSCSYLLHVAPFERIIHFPKVSGGFGNIA